jgi:hypothetical protein
MRASTPRGTGLPSRPSAAREAPEVRGGRGDRGILGPCLGRGSATRSCDQAGDLEVVRAGRPPTEAGSWQRITIRLPAPGRLAAALRPNRPRDGTEWPSGASGSRMQLRSPSSWGRFGNPLTLCAMHLPTV